MEAGQRHAVLRCLIAMQSSCGIQNRNLRVRLISLFVIHQLAHDGHMELGLPEHMHQLHLLTVSFKPEKKLALFRNVIRCNE